MKLPFRKFHILKILNEYSNQNLPLDVFFRHYFRANKSLGSKDRQHITHIIYEMTRNRSLIDYVIKAPITWEKRLEAFETLDLDKKKRDLKIPDYIRVSFPKKYFDKIKMSLNDKALEFCQNSNEQAPITIRVNPLKISRDSLFSIFEKKFAVSKTKKSPYGIIFDQRVNFFTLDEFKKGFFEIQDEGSQLVADLIEAKPKNHILDFCSGSGGKTLAFAHKMQRKGQLYLYDIREYILKEAKKRFKRAGIENFKLLNNKNLKKLKAQMDWVILDVPCSGSGTIRRNVDMKWNFQIEEIDKLVSLQRDIFDKAIKYLKPDGKIIYITCSIFLEENEKQINYFTDKYDLKIVKKFKTLPTKNSHDGFFACILKR